MPRPMRVELIGTGVGGEFMLRLPDDYTGKIQVDCSTGTVVYFTPSETRRPEKLTDVDLREG